MQTTLNYWKGDFDSLHLTGSHIRIPLVTDRDKWLSGFGVYCTAGGKAPQSFLLILCA